jgi:peptidoglycan endopeptidase LytE
VAGDFLAGIAKRHGVSLGALLRENDLTVTSLIIPGRKLDLPAGATSPTPQATPAAPQPTTAGGLTYTVVAGDSLSRIANRHGVALTSLLRANDLTMTSLILPGRKLNLPAGATAPTTPTVSGSSQLQTVISYAVAQQGKPYQFFTKGPDSFDCSGLVKAAYALVGRTLVHYSAAQSLQGTPVDFVNEPILPGDLIFMKRNGSASINHVGMAISTTSWIQAAGPGLGVRIGSMPPDSIITAVRRILPG